jgi:hypothetical protein
MVLHLVLFRFKADAKSQLDEAVLRVQSMVGRVEVIRDLKVGKDFLHSGRSFDLGLAATLEDRHALEVYDSHPDHLPVKQFLGPLIEQSVSVDLDY